MRAIFAGQRESTGSTSRTPPRTTPIVSNNPSGPFENTVMCCLNNGMSDLSLAITANKTLLRQGNIFNRVNFHRRLPAERRGHPPAPRPWSQTILRRSPASIRAFTAQGLELPVSGFGRMKIRGFTVEGLGFPLSDSKIGRDYGGGLRV